jgi:hypothetical protein
MEWTESEGELLREPSLLDARFAGDEEDEAPAADRASETCAQLGKFADPTHEPGGGFRRPYARAAGSGPLPMTDQCCCRA